MNITGITKTTYLGSSYYSFTFTPTSNTITGKFTITNAKDSDNNIVSTVVSQANLIIIDRSLPDVWLDASHSSMVYSGTTLTSWASRSGSSTITKRTDRNAIVNVASLNGLNTVYMNSNNDYLNPANSFNNYFKASGGNISNTYTIFVVMKIQNFGGQYLGGYVFGLEGAAGRTWNNLYGDYMQSGKGFTSYQNAVLPAITLSATLPTQWFIAEASSAPNDATSFYKVGNTQKTFTGSSVVLPEFNVGSPGVERNHACDCHIAEFRYYNKRLNTTDHATVLSGLKTKWGLP
jgi:hypothetical protein